MAQGIILQTTPTATSEPSQYLVATVGDNVFAIADYVGQTSQSAQALTFWSAGQSVTLQGDDLNLPGSITDFYPASGNHIAITSSQAGDPETYITLFEGSQDQGNATLTKVATLTVSDYNAITETSLSARPLLISTDGYIVAPTGPEFATVIAPDDLSVLEENVPLTALNLYENEAASLLGFPTTEPVALPAVGIGAQLAPTFPTELVGAWADMASQPVFALSDGSALATVVEKGDASDPTDNYIGFALFSPSEIETITGEALPSTVGPQEPIYLADYVPGSYVPASPPAPEDAAFVGDGSNNEFYANSGDDTLIGKGGDDYLEGWVGDDLLRGGKDDDDLYGWDGHDTLFGGKGNDELYGWDGRDKMHGGKGDDELYGWDGRDSLFGGKGEDNLYGWHGKDLIRGGQGDDDIYGGTGNDRLFGGKGEDEIYGGTGNDKLFGKGGDDELYAQSGNNTMDGGWGDNGFTDGSGDDLILSNGRFDDVDLGGGNNTVVADADVTQINVAHEGFEDGGFSDGVTEVENFDLGQDILNLVVVGGSLNASDAGFKDFVTGEISIDGDDAFLSLGDGRSLKMINVVDDDSVTAEDLTDAIFFDI